MKLIGKKVERLNRFGDDLCIELRDQGKMKLSPALMSRLRISSSNNKIGFAYPENDLEHLSVYTAPDGNGVAVNKQGVMINMPHNRDIRSTLKTCSTGECKVYVAEKEYVDPIHRGYVFYKITSEEEVPTTEMSELTNVVTEEEPIDDWDTEEISNETKVENTIDDLHQAVEKSGGEVVEVEESSNNNDDEKDSLDLF